MSGATTAAYLAGRAAPKERVRILYRRALKDTLYWAVHRHFIKMPLTFTRNSKPTSMWYNKWRHPDPYIVPWAPGGSKFTQYPVPPSGIEIVYDYGREDDDLNHKHTSFLSQEIKA